MPELEQLGTEADIDWVARACGLAFAGTAEGARKEWMEPTGIENYRVLRDAEGPAATLLIIPMGQFFGGRSVPMQGIAGVAVPPETRGKGAGLRLMQAQVRDAAEEGIPLSCLFCSTQAFYRQVGYEQAGLMLRHTVPLRTIGVRDRSMVVRELGESDREIISDCYRAFAARYDGMLDRGPYIWGRVRKRRDYAFTAFGFFAPEGDAHAGRLEGYLFMEEVRKDTGRYDVVLSDLAFLTPRAGRRLLGFLADTAQIGDDAVFFGGPVHPVLSLMDQQYFGMTFKDVWMVRINLVAEALEARGYAKGVDASVTFVVEDELVEQNAGAWTVRVRGGRGTVAEGGAAGVPVVRCDVRGLAAVYAGFRTATQAASLGWMEGDAEGLAIADGVFGGGSPWMADQF